jgi:hypothetical protein
MPLSTLAVEGDYRFHNGQCRALAKIRQLRRALQDAIDEEAPAAEIDFAARPKDA